MEDLNSWLRRSYFSKRIHHLPELDPLQALKLTLSITGNHTSKTNLQSSPDIELTGKMQGGYGSKTTKSGMAPKRRAISEMLKKVKEVVRRQFVAPPTRERNGAKAVKSTLRSKKKSYWLRKYTNCRASQVGILDGSGDADWTPDIYELIRWKKMASRVRCPVHKAIEESKEAD
jgi:hypothetical protein